VHGARETTVPLAALDTKPLSLDPANLPEYALRTTLRMLAAIVCSLIFTFVYASLAAKSRRAEIVLIPILDILQSVPILGFLTFTVVFFMGLFPGEVLGAELASVVRHFHQPSLEHDLQHVPVAAQRPQGPGGSGRELSLEHLAEVLAARRVVRHTGPRLEHDVSMSGGWFFVVASEAITVGDTTVTLPGIGSYVALATKEQNLLAVGLAVLTMLVIILAYDQLLFRPIVAWADKFRFEQTASDNAPASWLLDMFRRTRALRALSHAAAGVVTRAAAMRLPLPRLPAVHPAKGLSTRMMDWLWLALVLAGTAYAGWRIIEYVGATLSFSDVTAAAGVGLITLLRVIVLIALATLLWVPIEKWLDRFALSQTPASGKLKRAGILTREHKGVSVRKVLSPRKAPRCRVTSQHNHDAATDRSLLEICEHLVDFFQPRLADFHMDLAFRRECDRFREVFAAAHNRAAKGNPFHDDIENRCGEIAGRQADEADCTLAPHHMERLAESRRRDRRHQRAMCASAGQLDDLRHSIGRLRIHGRLGPQYTGKRQLFLGHIEGCDMQAHRLGVLDGNVAQPANAGDRDPLAGFRFGLLDALVCRDAGAEDRRHCREIRIARQPPDIGRGSDHIFGEAAIDTIACIVLRLAQTIPPRHAILAPTAGIVQPSDTDRVSLFQSGDPGADRRNDTRTFMTGDKGKRGLDRPIAVGRVEVSVAHAGRDDLDQNLAPSRRRDRHLLDLQGLAECVHHRRFHHLRHGLFSQTGQ
jgi:hypothetical protein